MSTCTCWIIGGLLQAMLTFLPGSAYDGYSACPKQYRSSRYRAQLPCDFRQQSWCTIPGSAYPWHAVRRFVQDNHGLMRRMYGDERHISVLRAEIESNDVELVRDPGWHPEEDVKRRYSAKPHFRPANRNPPPPPPPAPPEPPTVPATVPSPPSSTSSGAPPSSTVATTGTSTSTTSTAAPSATSEAVSSTTSSSSPEDAEEPIAAGLYNGRIHPHLINASLFNSSSTSSTPKATTSTAATTLDDWTTPGEEQEETTQEPTQAATAMTNTSSSTTDSSSTSTSTARPARPASPAPLEDVEIEDVEDNVADDAQAQESSVQETLFQDAEHQEQQQQPGPDAAQQPGKQSTPLIKLRGVNACPVKEEVVAPFWANNTRGEVLALLNLYPFEQYVHWEKCTHEHKQMFCREGCRCEQQYRLHRLLAYDPNNECRGIFSDWFKFPSCCICRCYDLPAEMRFTSRSPRTPVLRAPAAAPEPRRRPSRPAPLPSPRVAATDWYRLQASGG